MARVELRGIRKAFAEVQALDGVSLDIASGEFFTLLGPSGCGKTTLLRTIASELYTSPMFTGFGLALNNGWYNTAATHKPLGLSITFNANAAFYPSSADFFNFRNNEYVLSINVPAS